MDAPIGHVNSCDAVNSLFDSLGLPPMIILLRFSEKRIGSEVLSMKLVSVRLLVAVFLSIFTVLFLSLDVSGATCSWTGATNTDWNTAGNWSGCGGLEPQPTDDVIVNNSANQPDLAIARTIHSLTVNGGAVLTLNAPLTMDGSPAALLSSGGTINGPSALIMKNVVSINPAGSFNATLQINSGMTTVNNSTINGNLVIDPGATFNVNVGGHTVNLNGDLTNNGFLGGASSTFQFNGTGKSVVNNGSITVVSFLFNTSGAKNLGGTGTWTGTNLQINAAATVTLTSNVGIAPTNFTIDSSGGGSLDLGGFQMTMNGVNFFCNSTSTVSNGTLRFQGTNQIGVANSSNFTPVVNINSGSTSVTNSIFDAGSSIVIDAGAVLNVSSGHTLSHYGDLTNNGTLSGSSGNFELNGTGKAVTNNSSIPILNFRFNAAGAKTLGGSGSWSGSSIQINAAATVTLASDVQFVANNFTIDSFGGGFIGSRRISIDDERGQFLLQ